MTDTPEKKALEGYFNDLLTESVELESPVKKRTTPEAGAPGLPVPGSSIAVRSKGKPSATKDVPARRPPRNVVAKPVESRSEPPKIESTQPDLPKPDLTKPEPPKPQLAKPEKALDSEAELAYLEDHKKQKLQQLLSQQTTALVPSEAKTEAPEPSHTPSLEPVTKSDPAPPEPHVAEVVVEKNVTVPSVDTADTTDSRLDWCDNGRPEWAQGDFDVLLFDVHGLALAVPLVSLGQIITLDDKLTKLQGQSDWFMGILPSAAGDIRTVNTALFVMPERYQESFLEKAKYVVTIDGLPWGLAVDAVKQPISLNPDDVKWRTERSKRPWLAGTVKSHMCALIDIPQMAQLLKNCDKNSTQ